MSDRGPPVRPGSDTKTETIDVQSIPDAAPTSDRELVQTRLIDAPRKKLFRAWTEPELMKQWFAPLPYTTPVAEIYVRPGGSNLVVMRTPRARTCRTAASTSRWWKPAARRRRRLHPSVGAVAEAVHDRDPDLRRRSGGETHYTAGARHWTVADREAHEKMGFHGGWGQCADQLAALVAKL